MGIVIKSIGPRVGAGTGSISGDVLTVSAVSSGSFDVGQNVSIAGAASAAKIVEKLTGVGGTGTYRLSASSTVGSASITAARDFAALSGWRAALPADMVADGNAQVAEIYNDGEYVLTTSWLSIAEGSIVTSAECCLIIRAAAGHSFTRHADRLTSRLAYDPSKGVAVKIDAAVGGFPTFVNNLVIEGIQFNCNTSSGTSFNSVQGSNSVVRNCLIDIFLSSAGHIGLQARSKARAENVLTIVRGNIAVNAAMQGYRGAKFVNCTVVRPTNYAVGGRAFGGDLAGTVEIVNCLSFGFSTHAAGFNTAVISGSNNMTSAASSVIAGDIVGAVAADVFVNPANTNNLGDFRLKVGSPAINKGQANPLTEFDIFGTYRQTADIGAYEAPEPADALRLLGPDGGDSQTLAELTISKNGALGTDLSVTISDGSNGTFVPSATITIPASQQSATVRYAPGSVGSKLLTLTNTGGLTNPEPKAYLVTMPLPSGSVTSQPAPVGNRLVIGFSVTGSPTSGTARLEPTPDSPAGSEVAIGSVNITGSAGTATFEDIKAGLYVFVGTVINSGGSAPITGGQEVSILGFTGGGEVSAGDGTDPDVPVVTFVVITPDKAVSVPGQTLQLEAEVFGQNNPSTEVTWTTSIGTISSDGLFTPPATTDSEQSAQIRATSVFDPTRYGTAVITIPAIALPPTVTSVEVTPATADTDDATVQFSALVLGTNNPAQTVTWQVSAGTIDSTGLFTPPAKTNAVQVVTVRATSSVDSTRFGIATVSVAASSTAPVPTVTEVNVTPTTANTSGSPVQFTATVVGQNSPPQTVSWSASIGTIDNNGLYTPPARTLEIQSATIRATSTLDSSKQGAATVSIAADSTPQPVALTPSKARTLRVLAATGRFEGGAFFDLNNPTRPVGKKDPDSVIDITLDWKDVLDDISDTIKEVEFLPDGLQMKGHKVVGSSTTALLAGGVGPTSAITFRIFTNSTPSRSEDRTVYLVIGEQ